MTSTLKVVAAVSGVYDFTVGVLMLTAAPQMARWFGSPPPVPVIQAQLNGLFLLAVAGGYYFPWRDPSAYRWYLWLMGPWLKGAGATLFLADHFWRGSPTSFLLFAASDGALAVATLYALLSTRANGRPPEGGRYEGYEGASPSNAVDGRPGSRSARPPE